jgi:hypothetical protein
MELDGHVFGESPSPASWQPDLDGVLLAQHVVVNSLTQNPSFIEVFTEFRPLMFPFHAVFFVVLVLRDVRDQCELTLTLSQGDVWSQDFSVRAGPPTPPDPVVFSAVQLVALLLKEGDLTATIRFRGVELGTRRFPVTLARPATLPASATIIR